MWPGVANPRRSPKPKEGCKPKRDGWGKSVRAVFIVFRTTRRITQPLPGQKGNSVGLDSEGRDSEMMLAENPAWGWHLYRRSRPALFPFCFQRCGTSAGS